MNSLFATLSVLMISPLAAAAPIAQHAGNSDPVTEGWTTSIGNPGTSAAPGTEVTASGEHRFWNVQDMTSTSSGAYYMMLSSEQLAAAWRFRVLARVIDSPIVPGYPDVPGTGVIVRDGTSYWSFYLGNDWVGPMGNSGTLALKHFMNTRDDYHSYVIAFSPNGPGPADDTADFFIDGQLVFAGVPRAGLFGPCEEALSFGPVSTNGTSNVNFELVRFEIPDPSAGGATCDGEGDHGGNDGSHDGDERDDHGRNLAESSAVPRMAPSVPASSRLCDTADPSAVPSALAGLLPAAAIGLGIVSRAFFRRRSPR